MTISIISDVANWAKEFRPNLLESASRIKESIFPVRMSKDLHIAFDLRQTYDYGELTEIDENTAKGVIDNAKQFVEAVESYLGLRGIISKSDT